MKKLIIKSLFSLLLISGITASAVAGDTYTGFPVNVSGSFVSELSGSSSSVKALDNATVLKLIGTEGAIRGFGLAVLVQNPGELILVSYDKSTKEVSDFVATIEEDTSIVSGASAYFHGDAYADADPNATHIEMAGTGSYKAKDENLATCSGSVSVSSALASGSNALPRAIMNLKFKATGTKVNGLVIP